MCLPMYEVVYLGFAEMTAGTVSSTVHCPFYLKNVRYKGLRLDVEPESTNALDYAQ